MISIEKRCKHERIVYLYNGKDINESHTVLKLYYDENDSLKKQKIIDVTIMKKNRVPYKSVYEFFEDMVDNNGYKYL